MAFSILNTPRALGRRLLRRAVGQRSTPTASSGSGTRRSPRIATAKSPKGKVGTAWAPGTLLGSCSPQCPRALPWVHTGRGEKGAAPAIPGVPRQQQVPAWGPAHVPGT